MTLTQRRCTHCGALIARDARRCSVCGANPDVGPLMVRRSNVPALPWRQVARPLAAAATVAAVSIGLRLARRLLPRVLHLARPRPRPLALAPRQREVGRGPIIAVRRRFWVIGDNSGTRQWGAEETIWHQPPRDVEE